MGLRQICHEHCPRPGLGRGVGQNLAETAALCFIIITIAAAAIWVLREAWHYRVDIMIAAGALVTGAVAGYAGILSSRRRARAEAAVRGEVVSAMRRPLPSQRQAITPGEVHRHEHLHLPDNADAAAAVVRAMRGER